MRINENFSISTPHALKTITEKPQLVNPLTQVDATMTETARLRLNELSQLKDTNKVGICEWHRSFCYVHFQISMKTLAHPPDHHPLLPSTDAQ